MSSLESYTVVVVLVMIAFTAIAKGLEKKEAAAARAQKPVRLAPEQFRSAS